MSQTCNLSIFSYSVTGGNLCTCRQKRVESMILFWHPLTCQKADRHTLLLAWAFKQSIPELVDWTSQYEDREETESIYKAIQGILLGPRFSLFCAADTKTLNLTQGVQCDTIWQNMRTRNSVLGGLLLPYVLGTVSECWFDRFKGANALHSSLCVYCSKQIS